MPLGVRPEIEKEVRAALREVPRFVLDEQTSAYYDELTTNSRHILGDALDLAIPPFERMWVELTPPKRNGQWGRFGYLYALPRRSRERFAPLAPTSPLPGAETRPAGACSRREGAWSCASPSLPAR
jgi:hypothetical protein